LSYLTKISDKLIDLLDKPVKAYEEGVNIDAHSRINKIALALLSGASRACFAHSIFNPRALK
jgi:hypothetical protein